jgi:hypothetical protein
LTSFPSPSFQATPGTVPCCTRNVTLQQNVDLASGNASQILSIPINGS